MFATTNPPHTSKSPKSKAEKVDGSMKHVQSKNPINNKNPINTQMYHTQKIVGIQRIRINIFIIKNHYFIFRSILDKRQGSESTSVLLEYLKTYFHKVELSLLLKN